MFSDTDRSKMIARGIDPLKAANQLESFVRGFVPARITAPCLIGDGIIRVGEGDVDEIVRSYEAGVGGRSILKFVPASGAATRMFKVLFDFRDRIPEHYDIDNEIEKGFQSAFYLFKHIKDLPFSGDIEVALSAQGSSIDKMVEQRKFKGLTDIILDELGYAALPKGLLVFHRYSGSVRLACEEHLHEGAAYCMDNEGLVRLHFTVSPEHRSAFMKAIESVVPGLELFYGCHYEITFSEQKPSTDTIGADENNQAFRDENSEILFRPGGHGALIENLNDLQGDIIFIKNIDNVVPERLQAETVKWKKVIGGILLRLERKVHDYLHTIDKQGLSDDLKIEILHFLSGELGLRLLPSTLEKIGLADEQFFHGILNRPVRVCGMVRNDGEPGGGPFWVQTSEGHKSLQIVESAQVDFNSAESKSVFDASTHFNPVDLVCSVRDFQGIPFDLKEYIDQSSGFISLKSSGGRTLKALELPGLWNGAMAHWLTAFVEVPLITFNPVKTINDLLREQHRA